MACWMGQVPTSLGEKWGSCPSTSGWSEGCLANPTTIRRMGQSKRCWVRWNPGFVYLNYFCCNIGSFPPPDWLLDLEVWAYKHHLTHPPNHDWSCSIEVTLASYVLRCHDVVGIQAQGGWFTHGSPCQVWISGFTLAWTSELMVA